MSDPDPSIPKTSPPELRGLDPAELLVRGLNTVRPSGDVGNWVPPTLDELGRLLPQYYIESMLGCGGMGAVYKGCQPNLDRFVAIKLLPAELSADEQFVSRFRREARTLAKLQHPGIVAVYDFGQTSEGHLYFVMEYVEGTDLQRILRSPGLNPDQALELTCQVCDALHAAHRQGVIHRDIKPANILITGDGRAKLADFGLARPAQEEELGGLTRSNMVMGTPDYMAPEQRDGHSDHRTDIYALGMMLYEMLTGQRPQGVFEPASKKVQVDVRIDEVVIKALQQEPDRRYQQVTEMKTDVDHIRTTTVAPVEPRAEAPLPAPALEALPDGPRHGGRSGPRIRLLLAGVAVLVLVCGGIFLIVKKRASPASLEQTLTSYTWTWSDPPWPPAPPGPLFNKDGTLGKGPRHWTITGPHTVHLVMSNTNAVDLIFDETFTKYAGQFVDDHGGKRTPHGTRGELIVQGTAPAAKAEQPIVQPVSVAKTAETVMSGGASQSVAILLDGHQHKGIAVQPDKAAELSVTTVSKFVLVPGLSDRNLVSLQPVGAQGWFLRHEYFVFYLRERAKQGGTFDKDATFRIVHLNGNKVRFETSNYPGRFLSLGDDGTSLFAANDPPMDKSTFILDATNNPTLPSTSAVIPGSRAPATAAIAEPSIATPGVPADAKRFKKKWYRVYLERTSWDIARQRCVALGGQLAIVPDEPTWVFLRSLARNNRLWLGATDEDTEGVWKWIDGTPFTFAAWSRGQPDNLRGNENYLVIDNGTWNDVEKSGGFGAHQIAGFICEWRDTPGQ
jgi:serine/threonine protein kinase